MFASHDSTSLSLPNPASHSLSSNQSIIIDSFREYICKLLFIFFDLDSSSYDKLLPINSLQTLSTFAFDPIQTSLFIQKIVDDRPITTPSNILVTIGPQIGLAGPQVTTIVLLKKIENSVLDQQFSMASQLQTITLSHLSPIDSLYNIVHEAISPYFNAFLDNPDSLRYHHHQSFSQSVNQMKQAMLKHHVGLNIVSKKIKEFEMSLYNCKHDVQIPSVTLHFHPEIVKLSEKLSKENVNLESEDLGEWLENTDFLNSLQANVNEWIADIQHVTKHDRIESILTNCKTIQEIRFWLELEHELLNISHQLDLPQAQYTIRILRHAKRFHATTNFDADTIGLKRTIESVQGNKWLMKDLPINKLLTANDITDIAPSIVNIFEHLKKNKSLNYSVIRYLHLIEAISRDLCTKVIEILKGKFFLSMNYLDFEQLVIHTRRLFTIWDDQFIKFRQVLREIGRKRHLDEENLPLIINVEHKLLLDHLINLHKFRKQHEEFRQVIATVIPSDIGNPLLHDLTQAYRLVENSNMISMIPEDMQGWSNAMNSYNDMIDRVESQIKIQLRKLLTMAKTSNQMFRIFSEFNPLFFRPKINAAVQEYQAYLIQHVKDHIEKLHDRFKNHYPNSQDAIVCALRDIPPVSGKIIWTRQIERQLKTHMQHVEDILGNKWELVVEGQLLKNEYELFLSKLNTDPIFDHWVKETSLCKYDFTDYILNVIIDEYNQYRIHVNMDENISTLFKEVRNLDWLGYRIPSHISILSCGGRQIYPFSVRLREIIQTYEQVTRRIVPQVSPLLALDKKKIQLLISDGIKIQWGSLDKLNDFLPIFNQQVASFTAKTNDLLAKWSTIEMNLNLLKSLSFEHQTLAKPLGNIQKLVDDLNLANYANCDDWTNELENKIEAILVERLQDALDAWIYVFGRGLEPSDDSRLDVSSYSSNPAGIGPGEMSNVEKRKPFILTIRGPSDMQQDQGQSISKDSDLHEGGKPNLISHRAYPSIQLTNHRILIRNQLIIVQPPLELSRIHLIDQLNEWISVITTLCPIQQSRYDSGLVGNHFDYIKDHYANFYSLIFQLTPGTLTSAYQLVESSFKKASDYVQIWLQYQSLLDIQPATIFNRLGESLTTWYQILVEINHSRSTFEQVETQKKIGYIMVDFAQVRMDVNNKYDYWHKELLSRYGQLLHQFMGKFQVKMITTCSNLESMEFDHVTMTVFIKLLIEIQTIQKSFPSWKTELEECRRGHHLLDHQRYSFSPDWIHYHTLEEKWKKMNYILNHKMEEIEKQIPIWQKKVVAESQLLQERMLRLQIDWQQEKPRDANQSGEVVLQILKFHHNRISHIQEAFGNLSEARQALSMINDHNDQLIRPILDEIKELEMVWNELSTWWKQLHSLKEISWQSFIPREVHKVLEDLKIGISSQHQLSQYDAFMHLNHVVNQYFQTYPILINLKSDALRERHWHRLMDNLQLHCQFESMTLGDIWNIDLLANAKMINGIILEAQGELSIEHFLKDIQLFWKSFNIEFVEYQKKTVLIKGWDELFAKISEHLNAIAAMKQSPYFKEVEADSLDWEDRLIHLQSLFDIWIEAQRKWIYLEHIFSGNLDIKHLLPRESERFDLINLEFLNLMKRTVKTPSILKILQMDDLFKILERLVELLTKIQKALGEYLEKQRAAFPRFYFIGDEDMLDIIGNSRDIPKLQRHFKKLFSDLSEVMLDHDNQRLIIGMISRDGERVCFNKAIDTDQFLRIDLWMTQLEHEMRITLALSLQNALASARLTWISKASIDDHAIDLYQISKSYIHWVNEYPAQISFLATQVFWTMTTELAIHDKHDQLQFWLSVNETILSALVQEIHHESQWIPRQKYMNLITELVHQRDVLRKLISMHITSISSFEWLSEIRFYWHEDKEKEEKGSDHLLKRLTVCMANAKFDYGFEYFGVGEKLVQTPLTSRCYLTLTQAMESRMGGNPYGPAGTGKTETVKALGNLLGRYVVVFCCDQSFDFQSMSRIFVGLAMCGAWGCFDEFNRLEERILSAVSQQIQTIQVALRHRQSHVQLIHKVPLHINMAIFVTMNPGYIGRSHLPDNLKQLFRSVAMIKSDSQLISQVLLYSQGFKTAEQLSTKIVTLFELCDEQMSKQTHYDFGLRALKSALVSAGNLKKMQAIDTKLLEEPKLDIENKKDHSTLDKPFPVDLHINHLLHDNDDNGDKSSVDDWEQSILVQSVRETVIPKLVSQDIYLFESLLSDVFPKLTLNPIGNQDLILEIRKIAAIQSLVPSPSWVDKLIQLYRVQMLHHGIMLVGPSGSGKTSAWKVLLQSLQKLTFRETQTYELDPKAMNKEELFGKLDSATREWTDGLFTATLRRIVDDMRGESQKYNHWIILDGDVDPEWVENLNALLDDNKILTLPNGERLALPSNVRILFEVQDLNYATLATVSRCGIIWFSQDIVSYDMINQYYLNQLIKEPMDEQERGLVWKTTSSSGNDFNSLSNTIAHSSNIDDDGCHLPPNLIIQREAVKLLDPYFLPEQFVECALQYASRKWHVMTFSTLGALRTTFLLLRYAIRRLIESPHSLIASLLGSEFGKENQLIKKKENISLIIRESVQFKNYIYNALIFSIMWGMGASMNLQDRESFSQALPSLGLDSIPLQCYNTSLPLLDQYVDESDGSWHSWHHLVPSYNKMENHQIDFSNLVVSTVDTVRHSQLILSWLGEHRPLILCGPPGSGKTMILESILHRLPNYDLVTLNFSSATTPEIILKTFEQHCEYKKTTRGLVLRPKSVDNWLIIFCDEVNLPVQDTYGTQRVISLLRQIIEKRGFWKRNDHSWVQVERIQFIGACNPPTDSGRVPLSLRFLNHVPLLYIDFPSSTSLIHIYGFFNRSILKLAPYLLQYESSITKAMIEFYLASKIKFTPEQHAHYIYSPRELTRWVRSIREYLIQCKDSIINLDDLVRLLVHEALRLFSDRLVTMEERQWTNQKLDQIIHQCFPSINHAIVLQRPILFSYILSQQYEPVEWERLEEYCQSRLRLFYEEELNVPLVLFHENLEHIMLMDRILHQNQGHLLLVGASGSGKTVLSRFVAWLNDMTVFTIKVNRRYSVEDFDRDLRHVMRLSILKKVCFIFDESNVLGSGFLERMNALLSSGEIQGLFQGEEYISLIHELRELAKKSDNLIDMETQLFKWFNLQIRQNLHIIFTMNQASPEFHNRAATSPALYNRCGVNWFGEWSNRALYQVAETLTHLSDLERRNLIETTPSNLFHDPNHLENNELNQLLKTLNLNQSTLSHRQSVIIAMVLIHLSVDQQNQCMVDDNDISRQDRRQYHLTPRHYLDFIQHFIGLMREKYVELDAQQQHLQIGLNKLYDTEAHVKDLQIDSANKNTILVAKQREANEKLQVMLEEQKQAELHRLELNQMKEQLVNKNKFIEEERNLATADLAIAEPALQDALQAVTGIKKKHLEEVRGFVHPPDLVQRTMEVVLLLLRGKKLNWTAIRKALIEPSFIPSIVEFDSKTISSRMSQTVREEYFNDPRFTYESVNHASQACGPLVKWITAQLDYSDILDRVKPLREKVREIEQEAKQVESQAAALNINIHQLEDNIARVKDEYALLISQSEAIKNEMAILQNKIDRSIHLLHDLSSERTRWASESKTFSKRMSTVCGDALLAAAFLTYSGFFSEHDRARLLAIWQQQLIILNVAFDIELNLIHHLSTPNEQLQWRDDGLPDDEMCVQNACMMKRFNRYPLIIDPSGRASEFIINHYRLRNIQRTSFVDPNFIKMLENALRFGLPLLVEDIELIDPILNPVLNKEIQKVGSRTMIRLGDQNIDVSPSFTLFLLTRDAHANFTPDLCSRVTFINFTITLSSLHNQCLHTILKSEQPRIHQQRNQLMQLQGEYRVKLHTLEHALLQALNETQGDILDDLKLLSTLEEIKKEAASIETDSKRNEQLIVKIKQTSDIYWPLAHASTQIYFTMEKMSQVHFLYQFSLQCFLDIFNGIFVDHHDKDIKMTKLSTFMDLDQSNQTLTLDISEKCISQEEEVSIRTRARQLQNNLFNAVYIHLSPSLLQSDRLVLALRLVQIQLMDSAGKIDQDPFPWIVNPYQFMAKDRNNNEEEMDGNLLQTKDHNDPLLNSWLNASIQSQMMELEDQPRWKGFYQMIKSNMDPWRDVVIEHEPFGVMRKIDSLLDNWWLGLKRQEESNTIATNDSFPSSYCPIQKALDRLLIIHILRPDQVLLASSHLVSQVFGPSFLRLDEYDFVQSFKKKSKNTLPILMCSAAGFNADTKVEHLVDQMRPIAYRPIALGSNEGYKMAENALKALARQGGWLHLKNIHLATQWLGQEFKKALQSIDPHPHFRLFLSSEISDKLPKSLLRHCHLLVFELAQDVKANLSRTLEVITDEKLDNVSIENARIYFLLAWFHTVVQERIRYVPYGWSKAFELNYTDLNNAVETIDYWINKDLRLDNVILKNQCDGYDILEEEDKEEMSANQVGRSQLENIPWETIRHLLAKTIYGGRIDNEFDQKLVEIFLNQWFQPQALQPDFTLVDTTSISNPSSFPIVIKLSPHANLHRRQSFLKWIQESLPIQVTPSWLGLPEQADAFLLQQKARYTLHQLSYLQDYQASLLGRYQVDNCWNKTKSRLPIGSDDMDHDDEENVMNQLSTKKSILVHRLESMCKHWLSILAPHRLAISSDTKKLEIEAMDHNYRLGHFYGGDTLNAREREPLARFLEREMRFGANVISRVEDDLKAIIKVSQSKHKQTNDIRTMMNSLYQGNVPLSWRFYNVQDAIHINDWIFNLCTQLEHLNMITTSYTTQSCFSEDLQRGSMTTLTLASSRKYWLGSMFNPEGFITSIRQSAARKYKCSFEELRLHMIILSTEEERECEFKKQQSQQRVCFFVEGLKLHGASWDRQAHHIQLCQEMENNLQYVLISCILIEEESSNKLQKIRVPVYLNNSRKKLFLSIDLDAPPQHGTDIWYKRGIAITLDG